MHGRRSRRAGLFAAVLTALVASAAAPVTASAGPELLPDLRTGPIPDNGLYLEHHKSGRTLLRFSNEVVNTGRGPLELAPDPNSNGPDCNGDGVTGDVI